MLWERIAPGGLDEADWRWTDERLARLRELGFRPIVGLLHHGSGPRHTDLTRPDFAPKLAAFARRVAERYPWLDLYTPVNEPLTTARFSGLYGHWYPHARDHRTFLRCLVNQCRGVRLAMRAIRAGQPRGAAGPDRGPGQGLQHPAPRLPGGARERPALAQPRPAAAGAWTGSTRCGTICGRRARRRSCGRSTPARRPLPARHRRHQPLPLERALPRRAPGALPGRRRPAATAATATPTWRRPASSAPGPTGLENLLREAWERYRLPVAVTEVHNGSTRDEQLRWLREAWDAAQRLRLNGVDIRAVTVWALLGSYEWNSLLTRRTRLLRAGAVRRRAPACRGRRRWPTSCAIWPVPVRPTTRSWTRPAGGTARPATCGRPARAAPRPGQHA